jgi:hypothetical protein
MELKKYVLSNGEIIDVSAINLKIDKYFQIINTKEAYCDEKGDYYLLDGKLFRDNGIYPMPIEIEQTSDNILDLAREGDLVRCCDIYELFEVDGELVFYPDEVANYLMEEQKNIAMLYKKVGNDYIGYKVLKEAIEKANKYDDLRTPKEKTWKVNGKGKIIDCCPTCKNRIKAFDRYCKNCGQALKRSEQ